MIRNRTREEVRRYDIFKLIVAAILIAVIVILLLRGCGTETAMVPTINQPAAGATVTTGEIDLAGSADAGSTIEVLLDGQSAGTVTAGTDGQWSLTVPVSGPGEHTFTARVLDKAGEVLTSSEPIGVTLAEPVVVETPTLILPAETPDTGELTLSGTGTPGSVVEIVANGEVLGTATVGDDGTWSFPFGFEPGDYDLAVRAVDTDGNVLAEAEPVSFQVPEPVVVETPTLTLPAEIPDTGELTLSGTGTPGSVVEIVANGEVLGTVTVGDDDTWSFPFGFEPGDYDLVARAVDADGNALAESETMAWSQPEPAPKGTCVGDPPHGTDQGDTYIVAQCEYLAIIATRTGVLLKDLIAANPQIEDPNLIYTGQIINIPPRN